MRVLKFGGTSVQDTASIAKVLEIVSSQLQENKRLIVVSSAMGGVTNQLLNMAYKAAEGDDFQVEFAEIVNRHLEVVHQFIPAKLQNSVLMQLKLFFNSLENLLQGVSAVNELSPKTKDSIAAYGELCANFMLSGIFKLKFSDAEFVDARKLISTDSRFGKANVDTAETETNITDFINQSQARLFCITGFIGANKKGQTTTLGRGGSDYTAALFGAALKADEIQIWTDVDGFMTADPRIVKDARSLTEITYTEAKELSYFGAKVIYPPTMIPAFAKRIPISIRNTFNPDFKGTFIHNKAGKCGDYVRGITSIKDINLVSIQGSGLVGNSNFSGRLFALLSRYDINVVLITQASSEHSITFAVAPEDTAKTELILYDEFEMEFLAQRIDPPMVTKNLSVVAIVGEKMSSAIGVSGKFFSALGRHKINVIAIAQGSSEYNISTVIAQRDLHKALNVIHDEFFMSHIKTLNVFCLGTGNIGTEFLSQIKTHAQFLFHNKNLRIKVLGITNSRQMLFNDREIELVDWQNQLQSNGQKADLKSFVNQMKALHLPYTVFVDNSASPAPVHEYLNLLNMGVSVVACNKIGNSSELTQYKAFKEAAKNGGASFFYETNVGAGLPIISTLKDLMNSGDQIIKIEAILSGTISYIFNTFKGDKHFYEVVKEAQELGFTEPDPRDDLSGLDFMRKMLILARDARNEVEMDSIHLENILPEACLKAPSVDAFYDELKKADAYFEQLKKEAEQQNKVLRYVGVLEKGQISIQLKAVDESHPFYNLSGSDNIIAFTSLRYTPSHPLVVKGPGAGVQVTSGGVFADLVRVGNN